MKTVHDIALSLAGQPVAALGGGPSLPAQLPLLRGVKAVSANEHGALVHPCDYIVAVDIFHTITKEDMVARLRPHGLPIVSPLFNADIRMTDWDFWGNSGQHAIWLAWALGAHPVLVAGMDCYVGDTYYHTARANSSGHQKGADYFLNSARQLRDTMMPGAEVRVLGGGLLTEVWKPYDPEEEFAPFVPSSELTALARRPTFVELRALETLDIWKNRVRPYEHFTLTESEAARLVQMRLAERLPSARQRPPNRPSQAPPADASGPAPQPSR